MCAIPCSWGGNKKKGILIWWKWGEKQVIMPKGKCLRLNDTRNTLKCSYFLLWQVKPIFERQSHASSLLHKHVNSTRPEHAPFLWKKITHDTHRVSPPQIYKYKRHNNMLSHVWRHNSFVWKLTKQGKHCKSINYSHSTLILVFHNLV